MRPIVECVPNFSEGRRQAVVDALIAAVEGVRGVTLLDSGTDPDHNRAVLTFVGAPGPVAEAAFRAASVARERIDVHAHEGAHPRIGATDVIPFVPLGDTPMATCVELAEQLGERIGRELGIPVFLYEQAARVQARRELADIRRGELFGLAKAMGENPAFRPDFGPPTLHPTAGATAIGARFFLIAFNVDLDTDDLEIAKDIAKEVRASSGGFESVKALGMRLAQRKTVQVSMNLTDYRRTSIGKVFRRVEELARARGVVIRRSEIIGLVPRASLESAGRDLLKLEDGRTRVLEERIREAITGPVEVHGFLEDLASRRPSPGGGSAAAMVGAVGAAAAGKVAAIAEARGQNRENQPMLLAHHKRLHELRWQLLDLLEQDADAYRDYAEARALPHEDPKRAGAIAVACIRASEVPVTMAAAMLLVLRATRELSAFAGKHLHSDVVAAASITRGAIDAAWAILRTNLPELADRERARELESRIDEIRAEARRLEGELVEKA